MEEQKSEYVFNSTLRALQVVLIRMADRKPLSMEWALNAVYSYLAELPMPDYLIKGYDHKQRRLLEQEEQVLSLLIHYITVGLFYAPIVENITKKDLEKPKSDLFRDEGVNRRNIMTCFLLQLLGKPLALLDIGLYEKPQEGDDNLVQDAICNTYTAQCARQLTASITNCLVDPFYLLNFAEERARWSRRVDPKKEVYEQSSRNVFLHEERLPLYAVAIYFYMVFVENVASEYAVPKVYANNFVFEAGLCLATALLEQQEPALQYRGLLMPEKLLNLLENERIATVSLELPMHKRFCHALCKVVGYSGQTQLRQMGVMLLKRYILAFDDDGKYLVLNNLMRNINHTGINGYLTTVYKDLIADAIQANTNTASLPSSFSGEHFRSLFLQRICRLPQGTETDLLQHSDRLISCLNALRYFALTDIDNRTGFWDLIPDLESEFLSPLREGLSISIAHYKAQLLLVETGQDDDELYEDALAMLDITIQNATSESDDKKEMDRQQKLLILNQSLCTLELMQSLLVRATELVDNSSKLQEN